MLRVALLVDGWNILKSADRIKRRVNLGQLPHIVVGAHRNRQVVFQRFYIGPITERNAAQLVGRIAEVRAFGYEWIQCATEGAYPKTTVDMYLAMDILTWAYCHSVDVIALCSGDGGYAEAIRRCQGFGAAGGSLCHQVRQSSLGHSLYLLVRGIPITLYVHPFTISRFSRPMIDSSIWTHILGSATAIPVSLLISLPFWKRRSLAMLPLVMLFPPYVALNDGINVMGMEGDFRNLVQVTGMPAILFFGLGALIVVVGMISLFALLPLVGLDPQDKKSLFVFPAAMFLRSALSLLVAHIFVLGSPIDTEYFLGREIIAGANSILTHTLIGALLAVIYVTLFRKVYPKLPAWLRTEKVDLTWKDLRIPGLLAAISVILSLR